MGTRLRAPRKKLRAWADGGKALAHDPKLREQLVDYLRHELNQRISAQDVEPLRWKAVEALGLVLRSLEAAGGVTNPDSNLVDTLKRARVALMSDEHGWPLAGGRAGLARTADGVLADRDILAAVLFPGEWRRATSKGNRNARMRDGEKIEAVEGVRKKVAEVVRAPRLSRAKSKKNPR